MTRIPSSIGLEASNAKVIWLSKLACRREDRIDVDELEKLSQHDSVEITFPTSKQGSGMSKHSEAFSNRRKYSSITSLPVCSIGCSKNEDKTQECIHTDNRNVLSNQWTSDQDTVTDFDDLHSCIENDSITDRMTRRKTQWFDKNERTTVSREVLSPTLQLLHEVHMKKWPSNIGVYFLPSSNHSPSQNELGIDSVNRKAKLRVDDSVVCGQNNVADSVQKERMLFRQQLRYEAIRKDLFDTVTHANIDKELAKEHTEVDFRQLHHNPADSMVDTIGCRAVSFWNSIPSMSNILLNVLPENEVMDDDSVDDRDPDEGSFSTGTKDDQTLSSYGDSETKSGSTDEEYDYNTPATMNQVQDYYYRNDNHGDTSGPGSFMDQSHIYLMMTNARQEREMSKKKQQRNGERRLTMSGKAIDAKNISELTIDDFTITSRVETGYTEDELIKDQNDGKHSLKEMLLSDFGWVRHFQPFGDQQIDIRQRKWLDAIQKSFDDMNDVPSDSISHLRLERRVAAKEALQRIQQRRLLQQSFTPFSPTAFDIWG